MWWDTQTNLLRVPFSYHVVWQSTKRHMSLLQWKEDGAPALPPALRWPALKSAIVTWLATYVEETCSTAPGQIF